MVRGVSGPVALQVYIYIYIYFFFFFWGGGFIGVLCAFVRLSTTRFFRIQGFFRGLVPGEFCFFLRTRGVEA